MASGIPWLQCVEGSSCWVKAVDIISCCQESFWQKKRSETMGVVALQLNVLALSSMLKMRE